MPVPQQITDPPTQLVPRHYPFCHSFWPEPLLHFALYVHLFYFAYYRFTHLFTGPSVAISALIAQLVALPAGKFLEWALPTTKFKTFGFTWSLNPGPFNVKEHTVITVMANAVYSDTYATTIFSAQRVFYNQNPPVGYQLLLSLSSQMIGYAWAGIARQLLIWPASMIWPSSLVSCALLNTLNRNWGKKETKHISREKFFLFVALGGTLWYFVPGFLFTGLSVFSWACWIAPQNQTVNTLFGYNTGLGFGFLTFDWSMISWLGSPLVSPVRLFHFLLSMLSTDRLLAVVD